MILPRSSHSQSATCFLTGLGLLFASPNANAEQMNCVATATITCSASACEVKPEEDEPLGFAFDTEKGTFDQHHSEASRSGQAKFVAEGGQMAFAVLLGPAMQGGNVLSEDKKAITFLLDGEKRFSAVMDGQFVVGTCE